MLLLATSVSLAAAPVAVPGGLFDPPSLRVAPDGTVHALVSPKQVRLSAITSQITLTNEDGEVLGRVGGPPVRHATWSADGTLTVTPVPGPGGGEWAAELQVTTAALDLGADGQPVIVILGRRCPEGGACVDRAWLATPDGSGGLVTRDLPVSDGAHRGLVLRADADGWVAVSHVVGAAFTGFVVWDDGALRPWIPVARGEPRALLVRDGVLQLLFRAGDALLLGDGVVAPTPIADDARHGADAVVLPDGTVQYTLYDAGSRRLRGGVAGSGASPAEIDGPESGWFNTLVSIDGSTLAAWYYYRNTYNKGVRLGLRPPGEATWARWTQIRSDRDNVGWGVDLAAGPGGSFALAAVDRSNHEVVLHRWASVDEARAAAIPDAGDWTDRRRNTFFFAYGGGWYQWWGIDARPPSAEDFAFDGVGAEVGAYGVRPGLGLEGGFAGKFGPVDLVLEYMRRNEQDEAFQTIDRLQNLVGKLGLQDVPLPDSELQLHLRTSDLAAAYLGTDGAVRPFGTADRLVELRYVGKQGYHFGLRYHGFAGPTDVFLSRDRVVFDRLVADGRFTTGSIVGGWSVMDYLKKYEVRFFGPYLDAQVGVGYASVVLRPEARAATGSATAGTAQGSGAPSQPFTVSGLTLTGNGDLGLAAYRRVRTLGGAGGFVRVGVRGWLQLTGNSEPEAEAGSTGTATGTAPDAPFPNFLRVDRRAGPYANVGVVF